MLNLASQQMGANVKSIQVHLVAFQANMAARLFSLEVNVIKIGRKCST